MAENELLIKERRSLISSSDDEGYTEKFGHFLKPSILPSNQAQIFLNPLPKYLPTEPISPIHKSLTSKIRFNGWTQPLPNWSSWVENLRPSFESTWKKASIFEAIMCSTLEISRYKTSIFGLAEKWCPETNTFILPWGEVTITLEDVFILGGFSTTGACVLSELCSKKPLAIVKTLLAMRAELLKNKCKRPSHKQWMDKWMGTGHEFEHEAFLSLWLSRYVLPANDCGTINKRVFQIAILLSRGFKIALAPAVLASIYRDLKLLKEKITAIRALGDQEHGKVSNFLLCAPLYLLQMWFWERFSKFSPKSNPMTIGSFCWAERWHRVKVLENCEVGLVTDHACGDFNWRPYSITLDNNFSPIYLNLDRQSYGRCIRVSQLVGLNCIEPYFPHRVARQFGLDQDIPDTIIFRSENTKEIAWSNYNRAIVEFKLHMPPKLFKAGVTPNYFDWWSKINNEGITNMSTTEEDRLEKNDELDVPPGFSPIQKRVAAKVANSSHQHHPGSKRSKQYTNCLVIDAESSHSNASLGSSSQIKGLLGGVDDYGSENARILNSKFGVIGFHRTNRIGTLSIIHQDNPSSSFVRDNAIIQERKCNHPGERTKGLTLEDGIETNAGNSIRSSVIINKEVQINIKGISSSNEDIDVLDRIVRLQKVVDLVTEAKIGKI